MPDYQTEYQSKLATVEQCLSLIHSGDIVYTTHNHTEPLTILEHLHERAPYVENVKVWKGRSGHFPIMYEPSMKGHMEMLTYFYGPTFYRESEPLGLIDHVPSDLAHYFSAAISHHIPDVYYTGVGAMDENGIFHMGMNHTEEGDTIKYAIDHGLPIVVEVNHHLHHARGGQQIPLSAVTFILEADRREQDLPSIQPTELEDRIGAAVADIVSDGDTIQLGIGGIPNAVGMYLRQKNDLGVHTEMFTNSMMDLILSGNVTGMNKNIDRGLHVFSFAEGRENIYEFIQSREDCISRRSAEHINPMTIARQDHFVSINTCVEIDLTGQVCSESVGARQISGSGGAFCCAYGAFESRGGKGILAFPSRTAKGMSKIKSALTPGAIVTIPRNYVDYIVTEYGVARLRGATVSERIARLIAIAHPDDRDRLREEAREIWPAFV